MQNSPQKKSIIAFDIRVNHIFVIFRWWKLDVWLVSSFLVYAGLQFCLTVLLAFTLRAEPLLSLLGAERRRKEIYSGSIRPGFENLSWERPEQTLDTIPGKPTFAYVRWLCLCLLRLIHDYTREPVHRLYKTPEEWKDIIVGIFCFPGKEVLC